MPRKKLDRNTMKWYRAIWLSCEQATFLMSKKEEGKLAFKEKIQLRLHLRICDFCTRFQRQVRFFTRHAAQVHEHSGALLREEKKEEIRGVMRE